MTKKNTVELLVERFFNDDFFTQQEILDKVLECRSVTDFQKLKLDLDSTLANNLFSSAGFVDLESKKLTNERLNQIFQNLKPVRGNTTFL